MSLCDVVAARPRCEASARREQCSQRILYQPFVKYSEREDTPECAPDDFDVRQRSRTRECFETQPIQGRSSSVQTGSRACGLPPLSTLEASTEPSSVATRYGPP